MNFKNATGILLFFTIFGVFVLMYKSESIYQAYNVHKIKSRLVEEKEKFQNCILTGEHLGAGKILSVCEITEPQKRVRAFIVYDSSGEISVCDKDIYTSNHRLVSKGISHSQEWLEAAEKLKISQLPCLIYPKLIENHFYYIYDYSEFANFAI